MYQMFCEDTQKFKHKPGLVMQLAYSKHPVSDYPPPIRKVFLKINFPISSSQKALFIQFIPLIL